MKPWSRLADLFRRTPELFRWMDRRLDKTRMMDFLHSRASSFVHRLDWFFVGLLLAAGASGFLPGTAWASVISVVLAFLAVVGAFIKQQHGARLCEQCVTEFTINAPEHAARHKARFKIFHHAMLVVVLPVLVFCVASLILPHPWRGVVYMVPYLIQSVFTFVVRFHSSYQPWCPWCQGRDPGGGGREPSPDPSGGHGRPLPVM